MKFNPTLIVIVLLAAAIIMLSVTSPTITGAAKGFCGDGKCKAPKETFVNCPQDCEAPAICGNNIIESGEECDGSNLEGKTCAEFGFNSGMLSCANCNFDTTNCLNSGEYCGDGTCNAVEDCNSCLEDCFKETSNSGTCSTCWKGVCDGRCNSIKESSDCADCAPQETISCCGDGVCEGNENEANCEVECGCVISTEVCDGQDNDCDQLIDEDLIIQCGITDVGACDYGTETCTAGNWGACIGNIDPVNETCDGTDDDCDGVVDEGCECINGNTMMCGSNIGECSYGNQTCINGNWGACIGEVPPTTEICNNFLDDDCNGLVDCADFDCLNAQNCQNTTTCNGEIFDGICPNTCAPGSDADCCTDIGRYWLYTYWTWAEDYQYLCEENDYNPGCSGGEQCDTVTSDGCCPNWCDNYLEDDIDCEVNYTQCSEGTYLLQTPWGESCYSNDYNPGCSPAQECDANDNNQADGCCPNWCSLGVDADCCTDAGKYYLQNLWGYGCYDEDYNPGCNGGEACEKAGDGCCPNWCHYSIDADCCTELGKYWLESPNGYHCMEDDYNPGCDETHDCDWDLYTRVENDGCCPNWCGESADVDCCEQAGKYVVFNPETYEGGRWICYDEPVYNNPYGPGCDSYNYNCESAGDGCCPNHCAGGADADCCTNNNMYWLQTEWGYGCYSEDYPSGCTGGEACLADDGCCPIYCPTPLDPDC